MNVLARLLAGAELAGETEHVGAGHVSGIARGAPR